MSTGWPYPVVAALGDREKATAWELLDDLRDQQQNRG